MESTFVVSFWEQKSRSGFLSTCPQIPALVPPWVWALKGRVSELAGQGELILGQPSFGEQVCCYSLARDFRNWSVTTAWLLGVEAKTRSCCQNHAPLELCDL